MRADSCIMEILQGRGEYARGEVSGVGRADGTLIGRKGKIIRYAVTTKRGVTSQSDKTDKG